MPSIKLSLPHTLGAAEAKTRISKISDDARAQFGGMVTDAKQDWNGNVGTFSFRAMGFNVAGQLDVQPSLVNIELNLPLAALPFMSKVEEQMKTRAKALLA